MVWGQMSEWLGGPWGCRDNGRIGESSWGEVVRVFKEMGLIWVEMQWGKDYRIRGM